MPPDANLIARIVLDDDRHAFAELVRRHQSPVRRFLRRMTGGDTALADDLAQETFLAAYRQIATYRGEGRFLSWLYQIAFNVFRAEKRKRRDAAQPAALHEEAAPATLDHAVLRHDLTQAMTKLDEVERAALALCFGTELSHEEAADVLDCRLGTLKTYIARAKEKLGGQLEAWRHHPRPSTSPSPIKECS